VLESPIADLLARCERIHVCLTNFPPVLRQRITHQTIESGSEDLTPGLAQYGLDQSRKRERKNFLTYKMPVSNSSVIRSTPKRKRRQCGRRQGAWIGIASIGQFRERPPGGEKKSVLAPAGFCTAGTCRLFRAAGMARGPHKEVGGGLGSLV